MHHSRLMTCSALILIFLISSGCLSAQPTSDNRASDAVDACLENAQIKKARKKRIRDEVAALENEFSESKRTDELNRKIATLLYEIEDYQNAYDAIVKLETFAKQPPYDASFVDDLLLEARCCIGIESEIHRTAALNILRRASQVEPDRPEIQFLRYDAYKRLGRAEAARNAISKAIQADPTNAKYLLKRAWLSVESKNIRDRESFFRDIEMAKSLSPLDYAPAYYEATNAYENDEFDKALDLYDEALVRPPHSQCNLVSIFLIRADIFVRQGRFELAVDSCRLLQRVESENYEAAMILAKSLIKLGRFHEAKEVLDVTINHASIFNIWDVHYQRGLVHKKLGNVEMMVRDFKEAKSYNSQLASEVDREITLGEKHIRIAGLEQRIQEHPNDSESLIERAILKRELKKYRDSEKDIRRAIGISPAKSTYYWELGRTLSHIDHSPAVEAYSKAIELDGENWRAYVSRANSLRWLKRFEEAKNDCTQVIKALKGVDFDDWREAEVLKNAYFYRGHAKRLLGQSAFDDYKASGYRDWVRDYQIKDACRILEFDLPIESAPNDLAPRLARTQRIIRYLERNLGIAANTGKTSEGWIAVRARMLAKSDVKFILQREPNHPQGKRLEDVLRSNATQAGNLQRGFRVPDDLDLMMKSIEDNWRRQNSVSPRANR